MTKDEALDLALEALENLFGIPAQWTGEGGGDVAVWRLGGSHRAKAAITAIKQARSAPVQEPVVLPCCGYTDASAVKWNPFNGVVQCHNCGQTYTPPAAPVQEPDHGDELTIAYMSGVQRGKELAAQRQWVGLTAAEQRSIEKKHIFVEDAIRLTEAKLKEKNNG